MNDSILYHHLRRRRRDRHLLVSQQYNSKLYKLFCPKISIKLDKIGS